MSAGELAAVDGYNSDGGPMAHLGSRTALYKVTPVSIQSHLYNNRSCPLDPRAIATICLPSCSQAYRCYHVAESYLQ